MTLCGVFHWRSCSCKILLFFFKPRHRTRRLLGLFLKSKRFIKPKLCQTNWFVLLTLTSLTSPPPNLTPSARCSARLVPVTSDKISIVLSELGLKTYITRQERVSSLNPIPPSPIIIPAVFLNARLPPALLKSCFIGDEERKSFGRGSRMVGWMLTSELS